jgi:pyruvate/2-oxoacid:ferredoxin oxidoreductase alpha subunit
VDLIVGEMEFDTSKIGKVEDPRTGGYMLTAENEGYNPAKEERLRKENELVHRVIHPFFNRSKEQLREHDSKVSKETEEQKKKTRDLAGLSTPAETGGSDDSAEVIIVYGSAKKKGVSRFSQEKTLGKNMEGGVRKKLIKKRTN